MSDQQEIDNPAILWQRILRTITLPFHGRRVAKFYQWIGWDQNSPLRQFPTTSSAYCLETREEIVVENYKVFLHAGGEDFQYIKALNDSPCHIQLIRQQLQQLQG